MSAVCDSKSFVSDTYRAFFIVGIETHYREATSHGPCSVLNFSIYGTTEVNFCELRGEFESVFGHNLDISDGSTSTSDDRATWQKRVAADRLQMLVN